MRRLPHSFVDFFERFSWILYICIFLFDNVGIYIHLYSFVTVQLSATGGRAAPLAPPRPGGAQDTNKQYNPIPSNFIHNYIPYGMEYIQQLYPICPIIGHFRGLDLTYRGAPPAPPMAAQFHLIPNFTTYYYYRAHSVKHTIRTYVFIWRTSHTKRERQQQPLSYHVVIYAWYW